MLPWLAALCATVGAAVGQDAAAASSSAQRSSSASPVGGDVSPVVSLLIVCAALDSEHRAALEARARAELAAAPLPAGEIAIECQAESAVVGWHTENGGRRRESVHLDADQSRAVDGLLGAVHALRFAAADGRAVESVATPVPPAAPTERRVRALASPLASASANPSASPLANSPAREAPVDLHATGAKAAAPGSYALGAAAGMEGELWRGAIGGLVGARLGLRLSSAPRRWSVDVVGGFGWGVSTTQGISARMLRARVGVAYAPITRVAFGLGAEAKLLTAELSQSTGTSVLRSGLTEAAVLYVRYRLPLGSFRLALGPDIEAQARPVAVQLGGVEVFRVPSVVAGFSVEGEADIIR